MFSPPAATIFLEINFAGSTSLTFQPVHAVGKTELLTRSMFVPPACHQIGSSASRGTLLHCHLPSVKVGTPVFSRGMKKTRDQNRRR